MLRPTCEKFKKEKQILEPIFVNLTLTFKISLCPNDISNFFGAEIKASLFSIKNYYFTNTRLNTFKPV
jgi:hypothetical protein